MEIKKVLLIWPPWFLFFFIATVLLSYSSYWIDYVYQCIFNIHWCYCTELYSMVTQCRCIYTPGSLGGASLSADNSHHSGYKSQVSFLTFLLSESPCRIIAILPLASPLNLDCLGHEYPVLCRLMFSYSFHWSHVIWSVVVLCRVVVVQRADS